MTGLDVIAPTTAAGVKSLLAELKLEVVISANKYLKTKGNIDSDPQYLDKITIIKALESAYNAINTECRSHWCP